VKRILLSLILFLMAFTLGACQRPVRLEPAASLPTAYAEILQTLTPGSGKTSAESGEQGGHLDPTSTPGQAKTIWLHPGLPEAFVRALDLGGLARAEDQAGADLILAPVPISEGTADSPIWTYALAAPFYTVTDELSLAALKGIWQGQPASGFEKIILTADTKAALTVLLGEPNEATVAVLGAADLQSYALAGEGLLAVLPFDALTPTWKVLRVEGRAPIDADFDPALNPLAVQFELQGDRDQAPPLPAGNYSPDRRTVLVMTGVTALTRATAYQMEIRGNTFPGTDIQNWLTSADLTHISNEVPFAENCPSPDPNQPNLIFCSSPDRIELLDYVGTDIIELTGNHMLDYGAAAMNLTLQMYADRGWTYYAGGWDLADAQTPRLVTHNGNKLAFIGCNPVGPASDFATASQPGSAPCGDYGWILGAISAAKAQGYLPIVTLQYNEDYTAIPSSQMIADFQSLVDAGAVVVNGSQAHTPKVMTFYKDGFIHYGLGNLFFDQMNVYYGETYMPYTRDEFIDRLVFYDNRLASVELLTAELENYARPRPMTADEREAFLGRIFTAAQDYLE